MLDRKLWKIIAEVEHNGKLFAVLKGKNRALYFLEKVSNDKYTYPSVEDYAYLSKKLNYTFKKGISYMASFDLDKLFVRAKSNGKEKLLSLALVTSMLISAGCYKHDVSDSEIDNIVYTTFSEADLDTLTETTETTVYSDNNTEYYKSFGVTLEPYPEIENSYFVASQDQSKATTQAGRNYYNNVLSMSFDKNITPDQVGVYLPETNVSYKQVEDLIDKMDLMDVDKNYLKKGLNNLKNSGFDINLDILYYNLQKSKVIYWTSKDGQTNESFATFNCIDHEVHLPKERNLLSDSYYFKIICHEFFGHGLVTTYVDEYKMYCSLTKIGLVLDSNHNIQAASKVGVSLDEGFAEVMSYLATGQKISMYNSNYTVPTYQLITLLSILEVPLDEFSKKGIDSLYDACKERGFTNIYNYIETFDEYLDLQMSGLKFQSVNYNEYIEDIYIDNYNALCEYKESSELVKELYMNSLYAYENYISPELLPNGAVFYDVNSSNSQIIVNAAEVNKRVEEMLDKTKEKTL